MGVYVSSTGKISLTSSPGITGPGATGGTSSGGSPSSGGSSAKPVNIVNPGSVYQTYDPKTGQTTYGAPPAGLYSGTGQAVATPAGTPANAMVAGATGFATAGSGQNNVSEEQAQAARAAVAEALKALNPGETMPGYTPVANYGANNALISPSATTTAGAAKTYQPLAPSALLRGTDLKETDIARTTGVNIYKRDLNAEQEKISEFIKLFGKQPANDADWRKFHDFVYEGKQPFAYGTAAPGTSAGLVGGMPNAGGTPLGVNPTQSSVIADTVASATGGLSGAAAGEALVRENILKKMDELVSVIETGLEEQQNKLGLLDKSNKITDLETQIANETAEWDKRMAGNRDRLTDITAIERDEAWMIRQKNLALLPKIQLLAIQKEDYERAEQLAKDNAAILKDAKLAELDRLKMEMTFIDKDTERKIANTESQINREDDLMSKGYVKLTPTTWEALRKANNINAGNETDFVSRVYNVATGTVDIWRKPSGKQTTKTVKSGATNYLITYDQYGKEISRETIGGSGGSSSGIGFTATEKKKLEQAGLADADRQEQLDYLYGNEEKGDDRSAIMDDISAITGPDGYVDTAKIQEIRNNIARNAPEYLTWFDNAYPPKKVLNPKDASAILYYSKNSWK